VLQGIRGALIQTRAVKSVRVLPSRTYYLGTSIGSFVHAADELHHTEEESDARVPPSRREKDYYGVLMGTQLRVKNPCILRRCIGVKLYGVLPIPHDCCANTHVTL
jgi:hypothetical protein